MIARAHPLAVLLSGNAGVAVLTLARNIIAAHIIGAEQFGIAASFAIVVSAVEMATTLGAQQLIVREKDGDTTAFQGWLHAVQLARGLLGGVLIYLCAGPISGFLQVPEARWAFQLLAVIPVMTGLVHIDPWRYQRFGRFGPSICVQLAPAAFALLLIWPLQHEFRDFRLLLMMSILHAAGVLVMSHLFAERRFILTLSRAYLARTLTFGMPLAVNGVLLLATFHGEKLLVGHVMGPTQLAILAMGFTLTLTPALILGRSLQAYFLPLLTNSTPNAKRARTHVLQTLTLCFFASLGLGAVLIPFGQNVAHLLGPDFTPLLPLLPALAVLHAIRVFKTGIAIVALARGDTVNTAIGNLPRLAALPIIYLQLTAGAQLNEIIWTAAYAEAAGCAAASIRLYVRQRTA